LTGGLFVPKPSRGASCQRCGLPDLRTTVRQRPLASTAGGGDCYSLSCPAPDDSIWPALAIRASCRAPRAAWSHRHCTWNTAGTPRPPGASPSATPSPLPG